MGAPENPAAFPVAYETNGMSLRDWFAGQAVSGMLASEVDDSTYNPDAAAERAYEIADALLEEREKAIIPPVAEEPATEFPEPFNEDMEAAPTNGTVIMGRLADDTETMMVWWSNWPGWRATKAWNQMGEPVSPVAWRRLTASEDANFDDIPF